MFILTSIEIAIFFFLKDYDSSVVRFCSLDLSLWGFDLEVAHFATFLHEMGIRRSELNI